MPKQNSRRWTLEDLQNKNLTYRSMVVDYTNQPNNRAIVIEKGPVPVERRIGRYDYFIGIDCGVNTGVAVYGVEEKKLIQVKSMPIHEALQKIKCWSGLKIFVRVEDARLRTWFGKQAGTHALQGAGSIKRDCKIWEDFLTDHKIDFEMVDPKNNMTKLSAEAFKKVTKWMEVTNEHGRDAAMLVYGFNKN